jgi:CO dehydrogenase/acetyl-CoA synthase gamma subunit (corrinoid Fe-S protein)
MSDCCCGGCCCSSGVSVVSTLLTLKDILGAWKVRWGIGRDNYTVEPGLYAIGKPDSTSPVLVSANYKLTFDVLRK